MEVYKEMYYTLFHSASRAIEDLQEAQKQTEALFLSAGQPYLKVLEDKTNKDDQEKE